MMQKDLYKRLARVEAMANAQKAELMETLWRMYETACREQDAQQAAALVRKIRNRLLDNTDKEMSLDWARYRQALRDITKQAGFPFAVTFPTPPDGDAADE